MVDKVTKTVKLDLSKVPDSRKAQVKEEVGEFIVGSTLRMLSGGQSPVSGEVFPRLSSEYADSEKNGDTTPNLDLEGDMLNSLEAKNKSGDEIEVGIFKSSEVPKADGHNNFSGDSTLPRRRFVPTERQSYKREIQSGIDRIIRRNEDISPTPEEAESILASSLRKAAAASAVEREVIISDLFDSGAIDSIVESLFD